MRTQTLRHLTICSLMGVSRVIVAINKLDAVGFDKKVFDDISAEIQKTIDRLELTDVHIIPLSALAGDNVVFRSENMNWYSGKTLIESIQDWSGFHADILVKPIRWQDGYVIPPTEPGLGVELNEAVALANPYTGNELHLEMAETPQP